MAIVHIYQNPLSDEHITIETEGASVKDLIQQNADYCEAQEVYDYETGETTFELFEPDVISAVVIVNDKEETVDYEIKNGDVVNIVMFPMSEYAINNNVGLAVLGTIAGILLAAAGVALIASGNVAGGGLLFKFAWGTAEAAVLGGVALAAGGIGLALWMWSGNDKAKGLGDGESSASPSVRGVANESIIGNKYNAVIGTHDVSAQIVGQPFNKFRTSLTEATGGSQQNAIKEGDEEYVSALYHIGYSPLKITDIRLAELFLAHNRATPSNPDRQTVYHGLLKGTEEGDKGDIVSRWENNDVEIEILQYGHGKDSDGVVNEANYGSIYPEVVKQQNVGAAVVRVYDSELAEEEKKLYKNIAFKNGYSTNTVRFSASCPRRLEVDLDFASGLFASRNKNSETRYTDIGVNVAVQWRFHNADTESSDADSPEGWTSFTSITRNLSDGSSVSFDATTYNDDGELSARWKDILESNSVPDRIKLDYYTDDEDEFVETYYRDFDICRKTGDRVYAFVHNDKIDYNPVTGEQEEYEIPLKERFVKNYGTFDSPDWSPYLKDESGNLIYDSNGEKIPVITEIPLNNKWIGASVFTLGEFDGETDKTDTQVNIDQRRYTAVYDFKNEDAEYLLSLNLEEIKYSTDGTNWYEKYEDIPSVVGPTNIYLKVGETVISHNGFGIYYSLSDTKENWRYRAPVNHSIPRNKRYLKVIVPYRAAGSGDILDNEYEFNLGYQEKSSLDSVEVRVIRLTPAYLDQDNGDNPFSYQDVCTWADLRTFCFDKEKFSNSFLGKEVYYDAEGNVLRDLQDFPQRPMSEEDLKKFTYLAVRAKTDSLDSLANGLERLSVKATAAAPYIREVETEDGITKEEYFPFVSHKERYYERKYSGEQCSIIDLTEEEYTEALPDTSRYLYKVDNGNDFVDQVREFECINTDEVSSFEGTEYEKNIIKKLVYKDTEIFNDTGSIDRAVLTLLLGQHCGVDALCFDDINTTALIEGNHWWAAVDDGTKETDGTTSFVKYEANGVLNKEGKIEKYLQEILAAGRSFYRLDAKNRIEVVIEKERDYPVMLISAHNRINNSAARSFAEAPSGYRISFVNEDDGYEQNELFVMDDGEDYKAPSKEIADLTFNFVTNNRQVWSLGRFALGLVKFQRDVFTQTIGIEGSVLQIGDLVLIQDNALLIGTDSGGEIRELIEDDTYIYGFVIDDMYEYTGKLDENNQSEQGVTIMQPSQFGDSRCVTLRLATPSGVETLSGEIQKTAIGLTNKVVLQYPIKKEINTSVTSVIDETVSEDGINGHIVLQLTPKTGNMVAFGLCKSMTERAIVTQRQPKENMQFELTLMPYTEGLYKYGRTLPVFKPKLSSINQDFVDVNINNNITTTDLTQKQGTFKGDSGDSYTVDVFLTKTSGKANFTVFKNGAQYTENAWYVYQTRSGNNSESAVYGNWSPIHSLTNGTAEIDISSSYTDGIRVRVYGDENGTQLLAAGAGTFGADGASLTSVKEYYLASPQSSGITIEGFVWSEEPVVTDTTNKYLWNYEKIILSDGTEQVVSPRIIAVHSSEIVSVTEYYAVSSSNLAPPDENTFVTDISQISLSSENKYLWNYSVTKNSNGTETGGFSNAIVIGAYGDKGDKINYSELTTEQKAEFKQEVTTINERYEQRKVITEETGNTSTINISIEEYSHEADILDVYVNGMKLKEGENYDYKNTGTQIVFLNDYNPLTPDSVVDIVVTKAIAATVEDLDVLKGEKGDKGDAITVVSVTESDLDGGENLIEFSDGTVIKVKNGSTGSALGFQIVEVLPDVGIEGYIYFVLSPSVSTGENLYDEYVWTNNKFELLGQAIANVDLSDYYTKAETEALIPVIDEELSSTSTNPVQNKVVATELNNLKTSLPTDAVLHYSFDDLPSIPDGANTRYATDGNTYSLKGDFLGNGAVADTGYEASSNKIYRENLNGNLAYKSDVSVAMTRGTYISMAQWAGNVVKMRIKLLTNNLNIYLEIQETETSSITVSYPLGREPQTGIYEIVLSIPSNIHKYTLVFYGRENKTSPYTYWELLEFYVGSGTYVTPAIDNSGNGNNATTTKGVALKGISGKSFRTGSNGSIVSKTPFRWDSHFEYTVSTWVKRHEGSVYVVNNWDRYSVSYVFLTLHDYSETGYKSRFDCAISSSEVCRWSCSNLELPPKEEWFHFVAVCNGGSNSTVYINGVKQNFTVEYTTPDFNAYTPELLQIGKYYGENGYFSSDADFDDFQLFDRALTEQEVQALYLAKGNTPKYYTINDYLLPNLQRKDSAVDITPGVTGTLPVANGGTGKTTLNAAANSLINSLSTGTATPTDADYYVCQSAGGGTTDTTYWRRPMSALWTWIKGKVSSVLGLSEGKLNIRGTTYDTVTATDDNPHIEFAETSGAQPVRLTYTSYDTYQSPASLTLVGGQGGEYFIAPNIKATSKFYGSLSGNASTATKATQDASGNVITSTYATKAQLTNTALSTGSISIPTSSSNRYVFLGWYDPTLFKEFSFYIYGKINTFINAKGSTDSDLVVSFEQNHSWSEPPYPTSLLVAEDSNGYLGFWVLISATTVADTWNVRAELKGPFVTKKIPVTPTITTTRPSYDSIYYDIPVSNFPQGRGGKGCTAIDTDFSVEEQFRVTRGARLSGFVEFSSCDDEASFNGSVRVSKKMVIPTTAPSLEELESGCIWIS